MNCFCYFLAEKVTSVITGSVCWPEAWGVCGCHWQSLCASEHSHNRHRQHNTERWKRARHPWLWHGLHPNWCYHQCKTQENAVCWLKQVFKGLYWLNFNLSFHFYSSTKYGNSGGPLVNLVSVNEVLSSYYQLRIISRLKSTLSFQDLEKVIHAFITSRVDYCNSLYLGLPKSLLARLQMVQNAAARLLTGATKTCSHHSNFSVAPLASCLL